MQLRSPKYGPMICIPTGSPPGERPIGAAVAGVDRNVGLAHDENAGVLKPLHRVRIRHWHMLRIIRRAAGGAQARGLETVFDGGRQAVQRTGCAPYVAACIRRVGATASVRGIARHDGVESWIVALDPLQIAFQQLTAGNLAGPQPAKKFGR